MSSTSSLDLSGTCGAALDRDELGSAEFDKPQFALDRFVALKRLFGAKVLDISRIKMYNKV